MNLGTVRYVALAAALALIGYSALHIVDGAANAVVLMAALATVGTLLGRVPQAAVFASGAGLVGAVEAGLGLAAGSQIDPLAVSLVYLLAGLVLLACGLLLLRRAKADQPPPP